MPKILTDIIDCYPFRRVGPTTLFLQLLRRPGSYMAATWQAVHGHIEVGESAWQAALRELQEETGYTPTRFWQLEFVNTFYTWQRDTIQMCPGFAAEVPADLEPVLDDSHTDHRWVSLEQIDEVFMWPGQRHAINEIRDLILQPSLAEPHLRIEP